MKHRLLSKGRWVGARCVLLKHRLLSRGLWVGASCTLLGVMGLPWPAFGQVIDVTSLPKGKLAPPPTKADQPSQIGRTEKVKGIHPARPPDEQNRRRRMLGSTSVHVTLFTTAKAAKDHSSGNRHRMRFSKPKPEEKPPKKREPATCFAELSQYALGRDEVQWPLYHQREPTLYYHHNPNSSTPDSPVIAVHAEKLIVDSGPTATLHVTDTWVDVKTLGVRLIHKTKLPLAQIATGPNKLRIFAARDKSSSMVHFVVYTEPPKIRPGTPRYYYNYYTRLQARRGSDSGHSDCGFMRLSLRAGPAQGEIGSIHLDAKLSSPPPPSEASTSTPSSTGPTRREVRERPLAVQFSLSQTATDKTLVPSVSFGWRGPEKRSHSYY